MKILYPCISFWHSVFCKGVVRPTTGTTSAEEASHFFSDPKIEQCVDSLMQRMTLDEKIGQLVLYSSHFTTTGPTLPKNVEKAIRNGTCGNIFNAHVPSYNRELQRIAVEETRMGIPLLFGYDVIHGMKTIFPINLGMSCSWDIEGIKNSARVAAREAIAAGLNWDLFADGRRDTGSALGARFGRFGRGHLPRLANCRRHGGGIPRPHGPIPRLGQYDSGLHQTLRSLRSPSSRTRLPDRRHHRPHASRSLPAALSSRDRLPGVGSVMSAFNDIDAVPATASHYLMTDILRKEWGFNGFVVTDFTAINELVPHGVAADSMEAGALALNAGINMDLQGDIYHRFPQKIGRTEKGFSPAGRSDVCRRFAGKMRIGALR